MGIGERELQVGNQASISHGWNKQIGIFKITHNITGAGIRRTGTISYGLRHLIHIAQLPSKLLYPFYVI
jgi:hypothetical protein